MFEFIFSVLITLVTSILAIVVLFPVGIFKLFFGRRKSHQDHWQTQQEQRSTTPSNERKKIFDHNDGEYVDFEEIKE